MLQHKQLRQWHKYIDVKTEALVRRHVFVIGNQLHAGLYLQCNTKHCLSVAVSLIVHILQNQRRTTTLKWLENYKSNFLKFRNVWKWSNEAQLAFHARTTMIKPFTPPGGAVSSCTTEEFTNSVKVRIWVVCFKVHIYHQSMTQICLFTCRKIKEQASLAMFLEGKSHFTAVIRESQLLSILALILNCHTFPLITNQLCYLGQRRDFSCKIFFVSHFLGWMQKKHQRDKGIIRPGLWDTICGKTPPPTSLSPHPLCLRCIMHYGRGLISPPLAKCRHY